MNAHSLYAPSCVVETEEQQQEREAREAEERETKALWAAAAATARSEKRKLDAPEIARLDPTTTTASPDHRMLVHYGEAKKFVLHKSPLMALQEEVLSLRGHFTNNEEDNAVVRKATERMQQRWTTDGSARAIRERRHTVLLSLLTRLGIEEESYAKQRAALKMLRLQIALQQGQVKKDAEEDLHEEEFERERFERAQQAILLKAAGKRAALAKQQRQLDALSAAQHVLQVAAKIGASVPRHEIAKKPAEESDHEETEEEVQANAREDEEEEKAAAKDKPTAADKAFIAPEGNAN